MVKILSPEEINNLSKEEKVNYFFNLLSINPIAFAKYYLNNHFRINTPWFHLEIIKEAFESNFFSCASPRESAKSTIIALLMPLHSICFKRKRFILIVSNTYSKAANTLESIKSEFRNNSLLKQDFKVEIKKDREGDTIFKHKDGFEVRVLCKGSEQIGSVRGEKFGAYRPDMIIVDDLEDDELVKNPLRRRDLKDQYDEALIPAGEKGNVQVLVIGTILHDDSLMAKLVSPNDYKEYNKLLYRALNNIDGEKISLWPEKWDIPWLENLQKLKPTVFAKEYQNDPSYGVLGVFKRENFRYWTIENSEYILFDDEMKIKSKGKLEDCRAAISCDLAWEEKRESDYSVVMPVFLTPESDILVDNYICKKGMRPTEFEEIIFSMEQRLKAITSNPVMIGLEKAKLEKVMRWVLTQAMRKRNRWLNLKDLLWDGDKIQRIETRLESRYAMNSVYHKKGMGDLEDQLLRLRSSAHDDLADALQGSVQLLEFPRSKSKAKPEDDEFMWWRQQAINSKKPKTKSFVFGTRNKSWGIPCTLAYR